MSGLIRILGIIGSLAALAIILSPLSPFPNLNPSGKNISGGEPINETAIAPQNITQADFDECHSIGDGIQSIIVGDDEPTLNETKATDLLIGEYCNRPAIVHEISVTGDPEVSLIAYACDSASGKIGDTQLKDSLADHTVIYCGSASTALQERAASLREDVNDFTESYIVPLKEDQAIDGNTTESAAVIADLESSVNEILGEIQKGETLVQSSEFYSSAKIFDGASDMFEALLNRLEGQTYELE